MSGATAFQKVSAFVSLVVIQVSLALSYKAAQTGPDSSYRFDPASLMVVAEGTKMLMSMGLFAREELAKKPELGWKELSAIGREQVVSTKNLPLMCAILAAMYCANNNLMFLVFQWADSANINLIKGGASIVSTLLLRFAMSRNFSTVQWSAVWLQVCGLTVAQFGASCTNTPLLSTLAYIGLFVSLTITSVCSVVNEKVLKEASSTASLHTVNATLYLFGVIFNGLLLGLFGRGGFSSMLTGYDHWTTYPVLACNTLIGIAVSAVYKYSDATVKTFGAACATSILLAINIIFYGSPFRLVVIMGCVTVFVATHLYVTNPAPPAAPKPPAPSGEAGKEEEGRANEHSAENSADISVCGVTVPGGQRVAIALVGATLLLLVLVVRGSGALDGASSGTFSSSSSSPTPPAPKLLMI
jgi:hypothetical protein